ncbi:MAG: DUF721 domain-containing protein [Chlamydiota bacterium]
MKRVRKSGSTTDSPIKKIAPLLEDFLDKMRPRKEREKTVVFQAWYTLVGARMQDLTSPVSFYEGVLTVSVKTHTLYTFLCTHETERLLQEMRRKVRKPPIKKIRFKIG